MTGEQMKARAEWAKTLTQLANKFSAANTGCAADREVQIALAILVSSATKAGL